MTTTAHRRAAVPALQPIATTGPRRRTDARRPRPANTHARSGTSITSAVPAALAGVITPALTAPDVQPLAEPLPVYAARRNVLWVHTLIRRKNLVRHLRGATRPRPPGGPTAAIPCIARNRPCNATPGKKARRRRLPGPLDALPGATNAASKNEAVVLPDRLDLQLSF